MTYEVLADYPFEPGYGDALVVDRAWKDNHRGAGLAVALAARRQGGDEAIYAKPRDFV
jgi:hypothetical protein